MRRWMALTIRVPRELGEAVSNFLIELGATGLEEVDGDSESETFRAYFQGVEAERNPLPSLRQYLDSLKNLYPGMPECQIETALVQEQNWGENWKLYFKPVAVGRRFMVKPPWSKARIKEGRIPI